MAAKTAGFRIIIRHLLQRRRRSGGHVKSLQTMTIVIIIRRLNGTDKQTKKQTTNPLSQSLSFFFFLSKLNFFCFRSRQKYFRTKYERTVGRLQNYTDDLENTTDDGPNLLVNVKSMLRKTRFFLIN